MKSLIIPNQNLLSTSYMCGTKGSSFHLLRPPSSDRLDAVCSFLPGHRHGSEPPTCDSNNHCDHAKLKKHIFYIKMALMDSVASPSPPNAVCICPFANKYVRLFQILLWGFPNERLIGNFFIPQAIYKILALTNSKRLLLYSQPRIKLCLLHRKNNYTKYLDSL